MLPKLMYISDGSTPEEHLENISKALDAGVKFVQLRLKNMGPSEVLPYAEQTNALCKKHNAILFINDHPQVAQRCGAKGVHVGLDDMPANEVKHRYPQLLIGGTANTMEHIRLRHQEKVDYIGLGPFRFTSTKEKLSPVLGIQGYKQILDQMKAEGIHIPVYAIGGLNLEDINHLMQTGVHGIAVSSLINKASDKPELIQQIENRFENA